MRDNLGVASRSLGDREMKFMPTAIAAATILAASAGGVQAQSFRPLPAVVTQIPLGDDNAIAATLPFAVKVGAEAPYASVMLDQNAFIRRADGSDDFPPYFDDLEARGDTGQANYGNATVGGRAAFIATYANVGYCCSNAALRANVQFVLIDRSDIAPGDFDVEVNTQGLARTAALNNFVIDSVIVGRAGVGSFPADNLAYRATWTMRGGALTGGTGPTLVAAAVAVPTLSEWAMILLGLMLAGGAALHIQRRQMGV